MSAILLALCVIDILVYLMTYHLCQEYTNVADLTAETQMNKSAASLMAVTSENLAELHKIQHDINNQYAYMRAMLDTGDLAGLKNYLDELSSTFSEPIVPLVDCGNHTLDLILNMETSRPGVRGHAGRERRATPRTALQRTGFGKALHQRHRQRHRSLRI